jgi:hypothetical protein
MHGSLTPELYPASRNSRSLSLSRETSLVVSHTFRCETGETLTGIETLQDQKQPKEGNGHERVR